MLDDPADLLLPEGVRLVHIGPHKTGTTAIQGAFHLARPRLREHQVKYAGRGTQTYAAALAVGTGNTMKGEIVPEPRHWEELVDEVGAAGNKRVVISSEFYADAPDDSIERVVRELGGPKVHVVVTLRPLAKIVPSQWQQWVQNGVSTPYDKWLHDMLETQPDTRGTRKFWRRHEHGKLVERWAKVAGAGNLTVVVVDERDKDMLLRTFEGFVGLPQDFLVPNENQANRSLSLAETEIVRRFNQEFKALKLPDRLYAKYVRRGAVKQMKTGRRPARDEPRVATPRWALERAAEIGAESAELISSLGVRVIGDLSTLGVVPEGVPDDSDAISPEDVALARTAEAASLAVAGAILASGEKDQESRPTGDQPVRKVSGPELTRILARRAYRRVLTAPYRLLRKRYRRLRKRLSSLRPRR